MLRSVYSYAEALEDCGIKLLVDVSAIEPGEEFESKLVDLINTADVFYLMWSKNAAQSEWVDKESRVAVAQYDKNSEHVPRIRPVVIEQPAPEPPSHLKRFHFHSKWLALRTAQSHALSRSRLPSPSEGQRSGTNTSLYLQVRGSVCSPLPSSAVTNVRQLDLGHARSGKRTRRRLGRNLHRGKLCWRLPARRSDRNTRSQCRARAECGAIRIAPSRNARRLHPGYACARISSEARSATMMVGRLVFALGTRGMIEASTTRRLGTP